MYFYVFTYILYFLISRQVVYDVQQRAGQIQGSLSMGGGGGAPGGGAGFPQDLQNIIYKLQENMNFVRSDLANVANRPQVRIIL